jgi:hypothetical protein
MFFLLLLRDDSYDFCLAWIVLFPYSVFYDDDACPVLAALWLLFSSVVDFLSTVCFAVVGRNWLL